MKAQQATAESIISNFGKQSDFIWLKAIQDAGLQAVELANNSWTKLNSWKDGFVEFHTPIILYKKDENGIFVPENIGLLKKILNK